VLGLSVAVGSMIALLGVTHNFQASVGETLEKRGVDLMVVAGGVTEQLSSEMDDSVIDRVKHIPGVLDVDAALVEVTDMETRDPNGPNDVPPTIPVMVQGWPPETFHRGDLEILDGRNLTAEDVGHRRAVLGSIMADNLKKKVGDTITIHQERFQIVGIQKSINTFETGAVLTTLNDLQNVSQRKGKITGFSVRVDKSEPDPDAKVEAVRRAIMDLKDPEGKSLKLSAERPKQYLENASHLRITRAMAWMVSAIAIVIGVISMLNTMVMSVLERTQEIGILRAVGWTRWRVVRMVLGEAVFLGLAAAAVGTVGAVAVTYALSAMPKVNGFIEGGVPLRVVVQGVVITVLIGLAGGAYPAIRAARLLPTEAIRHD
jgi:putative ABC transport system permease protein